MTNAQIRALALQCGFELKEQPGGAMDLHPYVYEFARKVRYTPDTREIIDSVTVHEPPPTLHSAACEAKALLEILSTRSGFGIGEVGGLRHAIRRLDQVLAQEAEPRLASYNPNMTTCTLAVGDEKFYFQRECKNLPWGDEQD